MALKIFLLVAVVAILAVLPIAPHRVAWGWSPGPGGWLVGPGSGEHDIYYNQPGLGVGAYSNGYYAGQQDAIYDHDNNLAYNPVGQCLSCHSELYWHEFHQGYDQQWNSYQNQESTQGTSINIYGNNNYVNTNQYSDQNQQGPLNPPNCWGSCHGGP